MEKIKFLSLDGLEVYGHLSIPNSHRPLHALLLISGGIHGGVLLEDNEYDPLHSAICDYLNKAGFITFIVDKRGSKGYGEEYKAHLDMCGREVDDIIAGGMFLKSLDSVIDGCIAVHGTSRSATTAALALTRSDIFNAAILASGFYDIYKQYKFDEIYRPEIFPTKQSMQAKDIEEFPYNARSPINHVDEINCPILLVHGNDDTIVSPERSIEYYERLKEKGKNVRIVFYEEFAHFKVYSYPSHPIGRKYWDECVAFLNRCFRNESKIP